MVMWNIFGLGDEPSHLQLQIDDVCNYSHHQFQNDENNFSDYITFKIMHVWRVLWIKIQSRLPNYLFYLFKLYLFRERFTFK